MKRPSLAGSGVLERLRSTTFALLGGTALFGLLIVALMAQQGVPFLPTLPLPGIEKGGEQGVSGGSVVSRSGDSVSAAVPATLVDRIGGGSAGANGKDAPGKRGHSGLAGSHQIGSGPRSGSPSVPQPSPAAPETTPSPAPPASQPTATPVSQPSGSTPSGSSGGGSSSSGSSNSDASTAAVGGSTGSGHGSKPPGAGTPDSVKHETPAPAPTAVKPPPSAPAYTPGSGGQTDAEMAENPGSSSGQGKGNGH